MPSTKSFTLPEVAEHLRVSVKTVRRLIKAGILQVETIPFRGGKQYRVDQWALDHYALREWVLRQFCNFRLSDAKGTFTEGFGASVYFGVRDRNELFPPVHLSVSLEDYWRFACERIESQEAYDTLVEELRRRIPGRPKAFAVEFHLSYEEVEATLKQVVKSVQLPDNLPRGRRDYLRQDAYNHLLIKTLPSLGEVRDGERGGLRAYLRQSVRNFYIDTIRKTREPKYTRPLQEEDVISPPDGEGYSLKPLTPSHPIDRSPLCIPACPMCDSTLPDTRICPHCKVAIPKS